MYVFKSISQRKELTPREREKDRELVRRIQAAGIPIIVETGKDEVPDLLIRQDFDAYESMVFDVNGGAGLILPLRVTPNIPIFAFSGVDISVPRWANVWFRPLEDNHSREWPHYQFHGRSELKFDRRETINRFIFQQKQFRRGQAFHGLLLAFSYDPMPDELVRGEILRGSIKILDQFERGHSANISLRVDREAGQSEPERRRQGLSARPESEDGSESAAVEKG